MGRKRNQGKARRAAKAKQEAEEKKNNQTATTEAGEERANNNGQTMPANTNELGQALAVEIQRMQNDDTKCKHGFDSFSSRDVATQFVPAFLKSYKECIRSGTSFQVCLIAAQKITMDEYADVWNDSTEIELATSFFLCLGTQDILNGDDDDAKMAATFARYFEQYIAVELKQTQPLLRFNKIIETHYADMHSLVTFFLLLFG